MNVRQLAGRVEPGQPASLRERPQAEAPSPGAAGSDFTSYLERARLEGESPTISNHARQRMQQRGITMTEAQQQSLNEALQQLASKGARDALLMRSDAAFVVNVPNRTVVTAIDRHELQHRVFTQIDSAMLLET